MAYHGIDVGFRCSLGCQLAFQGYDSQKMHSLGVPDEAAAIARNVNGRGFFMMTGGGRIAGLTVVQKRRIALT